MESKDSELPKDLVIGRDGNIHIRLTRFIPLGDVLSYSVYGLYMAGLYYFYPKIKKKKLLLSISQKKKKIQFTIGK